VRGPEPVRGHEAAHRPPHGRAPGVRVRHDETQYVWLPVRTRRRGAGPARILTRRAGDDFAYPLGASDPVGGRLTDATGDALSEPA
jgi:hypothetical protein